MGLDVIGLAVFGIIEPPIVPFGRAFRGQSPDDGTPAILPGSQAWIAQPDDLAAQVIAAWKDVEGDTLADQPRAVGIVRPGRERQNQQESEDLPHGSPVKAFAAKWNRPDQTRQI